MPRPRFSNLSPERQAQILETSAKEFALHGYDGASLNHILDAAGVSKGAAYYYFDDKADLFATVGRHFFEEILRQTRIEVSALGRDEYWAAAREIYRQLLLEWQDRPWIPGMIKAIWRLSGEARAKKILAPLFERTREWLTAFLRRGQEIGLVRTDLPLDLLLDLCLALDTAFDQWAAAHVSTMSAADLAVHGEAALDIARRVLEPPAGS